jgi:hypothetical protein
MILNWFIFNSYTLKRCNRPFTQRRSLLSSRRLTHSKQLFDLRLQVFLAAARFSRSGTILSQTLFLTLTLYQRPNPFARCAHQPIHLACIILRFARIMLRFGFGVLSGRVPTRHTAFHNSSLGGSSHLFLHRYWHVWLASSFTLFTSRARSHMMHSQYQHVCALFFGEGRFFVVLVLLHANPPDGFCSLLLCRPHLPHEARPVCWLFNLCVDSTSLVGFHRRFPWCRLSATRSLCRLRRQHSLRGRFAPQLATKTGYSGFYWGLVEEW